MKQPIFVIKEQKVFDIINHQSNFTVIPYSFDWGKVNTKDELLSAISSLEKDGEYIRLHRVAECLNKFRTYKMIGNANRMLDRVQSLCKEYREELNYD